jgi:structural maintenance of chromosome 1
MEKAAEMSTQSWSRKKGINAEIKQFKEQKEEAERFEALKAERVRGPRTKKNSR